MGLSERNDDFLSFSKLAVNRAIRASARIRRGKVSQQGGLFPVFKAEQKAAKKAWRPQTTDVKKARAQTNIWLTDVWFDV